MAKDQLEADNEAMLSARIIILHAILYYPTYIPQPIYPSRRFYYSRFTVLFHTFH